MWLLYINSVAQLPFEEFSEVVIRAEAAHEEYGLISNLKVQKGGYLDTTTVPQSLYRSNLLSDELKYLLEDWVENSLHVLATQVTLAEY